MPDPDPVPDPLPDPDDLLAPADALAAMLRDVEKLDGIEVIVDRQQDLGAAIDAGVAKATGAAIVISLDGWGAGPEDGGVPLLPLRHSIALWTIPVYRAGAIPESVALGALVKAVHAWQPDPAANKKLYRWRVGVGSAAGTDMHNVYEFEAVFEVILH